MAVSFGFYDSLNGNRKYTAVQFSYLFNSLIKDGIFMHVGEHLNVKEGTGMQVNVGSGFAWFNSTWTRNDADYPLTITASDLLQVRIDAIVLEVDETVLSRTNSIKVITGTPSSDPQKPSLTNTADIHQYPLAYVTVGVGATSITKANIENVVGSDPCPFVTGILETIDISTLVSQWETQFNEWMTREQSDFNTWFAGVRGALNEDQAGKLYNLITDMVPYHYKAFFSVSNWSSGTAFTQTATLEAVDGGPTPDSSFVFNSDALTDQTDNEDTNDQLLESLSRINAGKMTLGNGTLSISCFDRPTTDLWVHVILKKPYTSPANSSGIGVSD